MFKLVKKKIEAYLINKIENEYTSLNKNALLMYKLCEKHPELAKNAEGKAASLELFKLALSHSTDKEKTIHELLWSCDSFSSNPECIKMAVEIDGKFIRHAHGKAFTLESYLIAINHPDESKRLDVKEDFDYMHFDLWETPKSELKKLVEYDGRFLRLIDEEKITRELLELAFNNPDPEKRPKPSKLHNISYNEKLVKELNKIDAMHYIYSMCDDDKKDLLKLALSEKDPEKAISYDRIPEDFNMKLNYSKISELIKMDKRWLNVTRISSMPKDVLISALKDDDLHIVPTPHDIENFDTEALDALLENARNGKYKVSDIEAMLKTNINSRFINSEFFREMSKKLCEEINVDVEFFNYHINRALRTNDEILQTIRLEFLDPRYHKIYEKNGYEKLYVLAMYPNIQDAIIKIGKPTKEDGTIDIELGNKKLELLSKMLEKSNLGKNDKEHKEWTIYYNQILKSFYDKPELYNYMANHVNELDDELLQRLVTHALGKHNFEIKTIEDLKNYEQVRNKWIEESLESNEPSIVKGAVLEKVFGMSYETAEKLYKPYIQGIKRSPEEFPKDIVSFYSTLDIIFKENNLDLLRETAKRVRRKENIPEVDIVHFRTILRSLYVERFNETLYTIEDKKEDEIYSGIKMFKAAGEKGDKPFNISLHSLGAYSEFDPVGDEFSFREDWNRPKMSIHGICTSYIGNNNLGIANIKYTVLGFTGYEEESLLLSGPEDIYSSNHTFSIIEDEDSKSTHVMPKDMIDMTRHTHNEMVFERRIGNAKRQPSYIVLVCDDYEHLKKVYESDLKRGRYKLKDGERLEEEKESDLMYFALKAAKDFGVPIVVVEREKIAKHEHQVIQSRLDEFIKDEKLNREETREYFHDLITNLENNHAGNRDYHESIDKKYFNSSLSGMIAREIKDKIKKYMKTDPQLALIMVEELEKVFIMESECKRGETLFDIEAMQLYCEETRGKITGMLEEQDFILDQISDDTYTSEFNQVFSQVVEEQLTLGQLRSSIDIDYLNLTTSSVDSLYPQEERDNVKNTILFAMMIGKNEDLKESDLDILLTASLYKDIDPSELDKLPKEDIEFIKAVIELHKSEDKSLEAICSKHNIDINNTEQVERLRTISTCLKDACELDKARNNQNDSNYINPSNLHCESSKKMVKVAVQISEKKSEKEIENICNNRPELYQSILEKLQQGTTPKQVVALCKKDEIKVSEEGYEYGQSTKK